MILALMGIIFLGLGIAFFVIGQGAPLIGSTFAIISYTFIPVGGLMFFFAFRQMRGAARRRVVMQTGLDGTATVTALSDTGITVNENPMANIQFLVQIPGRAPYPVNKRMTLPRLMVGRLAPGVTIPVKVDPTDPEELVIDWSMPNVMPGGFGSLMGMAYDAAGIPRAPGAAGVPGTPMAGGFPAPGAPGGFPAPGAPGGFPAPGAPGGFGAPGFVTTSTTVIDATGGNPPVAYVTSGGLDQATLDRINRTLYERGVSSADAATAAQSMAAGASIEQVLQAIGRGQAGQGIPGAAGMSTPSTTSAGAGAGPGASSADFGLLDPKQAERLAAVGNTGRATVDSFQDTGVASGDAHLYTLQLTVHVDGRPDAQVRNAAMVPQRAISRVTQGASLPVRVDPLDASQLLIEWDKG